MNGGGEKEKSQHPGKKDRSTRNPFSRQTIKGSKPRGGTARKQRLCHKLGSHSLASSLGGPWERGGGEARPRGGREKKNTNFFLSFYGRAVWKSGHLLKRGKRAFTTINDAGGDYETRENKASASPKLPGNGCGTENCSPGTQRSWQSSVTPILEYSKKNLTGRRLVISYAVVISK